MERPVVVGTDGSEGALQAVDWAADEAARRGLPLRVLYASRWERYESAVPSVDPERSSERVLAEHIVASAAERARHRAPGVKTGTEVVPDDPASALLDRDRDAALLVVGSRGRGAVTALLLGSVGLTVAARALCPVVVVRGDEPNREGRKGRVVVGVGEDEDGAAVRYAFAAAKARSCPLHVVTAWRAPAHADRSSPLITGGDRLAAEQAASDLLTKALDEPSRDFPEADVHREVVEGSARKALLAASADADLLVVGAARVRAVPGLQLGSVSHAVLHHASCPVAVVPRT